MQNGEAKVFRRLRSKRMQNAHNALLDVPGVFQPALSDERPESQELCLKWKLGANDIPDAWLFAAVMRQSEHLVSFDAGSG